jgi:cystathionine beta-lyase/cystathionine gamma-synthase
MMSILLPTVEGARTFYEALPCGKCGKFGNNFTMVTLYTVLTYYGEKEWATEYGIAEQLIRISIKFEDPERIRSWFDTAFATIQVI